MTNDIPRNEYPRPQFRRDIWQNLNGKWNFDFDDSNNGEESMWYNNKDLKQEIVVPFTYETKASGINDKTPHRFIWYQRTFAISEKYKDKKVKLNFSASDYITKVWINGQYIGEHKGGYTAFSFDITNFVNFRKENNIVIKVEDELSKEQPRGKQSWKKNNFECWYSRTTGIWQTVWLEFVNKDIHLNDIKITPDIDDKQVEIEYGFIIDDIDNNYRMQAEIKYEDKIINEISFEIKNEYHHNNISLVKNNNDIKLWEPNNPALYDINFKILKDNEVIDKVKSYFGMRKISIQDGRLLLNNKPLYQKLILDQGYWPETLTTPPSDEAIKKDLKIVKEMGFNGVRKHQKIEDDRFYYWADKLGILVWGEIGSTYNFNEISVNNFIDEWDEIVIQLYNHPSIIIWVPFNESWGIDEVKTCKRQQNFTEAIYNLTKTIDNQRPVITNDGWEHTTSDVITVHDYEEDPAKLGERFRQKDKIINNILPFNKEKYMFAEGYSYNNQPIIMSEFGGIAFKTKSGWGYGREVENEEELLERLENTISEIVNIDYFQGYCYTQLTDVEQEKNGLLTENREYKVDLDKIKNIIK